MAVFPEGHITANLATHFLEFVTYHFTFKIFKFVARGLWNDHLYKLDTQMFSKLAELFPILSY